MTEITLTPEALSVLRSLAKDRTVRCQKRLLRRPQWTNSGFPVSRRTVNSLYKQRLIRVYRSPLEPDRAYAAINPAGRAALERASR